MTETRFDRMLRKHGYRPLIHTEYAGTSAYSKSHKYFEAVCYVEKDSHGKGQKMHFKICDVRAPLDMEEFKLAEFDRSYLVKEAKILHEMFEALKAKTGRSKRVDLSFANPR